MNISKRKKIIFLFCIILLLASIMVINIFCVKQENIQKLDISVKNHRTDELVFSFTINDFIDSYNSLYLKDKKKEYLDKISKWRCLVYEQAIHSNYETYYYYFTENNNNQTLPILAIYVPSDNDYVQEIVLNFDYHSYMDKNYRLYEEMCYYTLKALFNDLSDEKIIELYKTINKLAEDNIYSSEEWYGNGAIPCALYYRNGVGIYPYFAIGEHMKMCVIPVTEQTIQNFKENGVSIYEF